MRRHEVGPDAIRVEVLYRFPADLFRASDHAGAAAGGMLEETE